MVQNKLNKVLFLQDHASTGGAAIAAARYANALARMGHGVCVAAGDAGPEHSPRAFRLSGKPLRGPARAVEYFMPGPTRIRFRRARVARQWRHILASVRPDLVWAHNLHGGKKWGWHLNLLAAALDHGPLVWTLHDMWALGDGRPYFEESLLPQIATESPLSGLLANRRAQSRLRLTSPSHWLCRLVAESTQFSCQKWECVIDPSQFSPIRREEMRRQLGLRPGDLFFIAVAENLEDPRKGMSLLLEAWRRLKEHPHGVLLRLGLVGRGAGRLFDEDSQVLSLGEAKEPSDVAAWFSAADLYLHPAAQDNFPLTVQEAQACGTPVLAFDRGGLPETLEDQHTGWLLSERSASALVKKLFELSADPSILARMRESTRKRILLRQNSQKFSEDWAALLASYAWGTFSCL